MPEKTTLGLGAVDSGRRVDGRGRAAVNRGRVTCGRASAQRAASGWRGSIASSKSTVWRGRVDFLRPGRRGPAQPHTASYRRHSRSPQPAAQPTGSTSLPAHRRQSPALLRQPQRPRHTRTPAQPPRLARTTLHSHPGPHAANHQTHTHARRRTHPHPPPPTCRGRASRRASTAPRRRSS